MDFNFSRPSFNATEGRELYTNVQLVLYFLLTIPTIILSTGAIIALFLANQITWNIRIILINVFIAEILNCISLTTIFVGHSFRMVFDITDLGVAFNYCRVNIAIQITGNGVKIGAITLYSILVYILIKSNINKVKWFALLSYLS